MYDKIHYKLKKKKTTVEQPFPTCQVGKERVGEDTEKSGCLSTASEEAKLYIYLGNSLVDIQKPKSKIMIKSSNSTPRYKTN